MKSASGNKKKVNIWKEITQLEKILKKKYKVIGSIKLV